MNFFLEKLIKFLCNYWPLSLCKILKKFLRQIQSYEDVPFLDPKSPICHKQISFGTNHYYYFHLPIGPFHCAKFQKNSCNESRVENPSFWAPNGSFAPNKFFFWKKIINVIFIYLLAPFILQNFEKILKANPDLRGCSTFGCKIPQFVLNKIFWYKPLLLLSSTYWPFSLGKILKKSLQRIKSYEDAPFLGPKWSTCPKQFFFWKIITITLVYLLVSFFVQNFQKILPADPELWGSAIFGP